MTYTQTCRSSEKPYNESQLESECEIEFEFDSDLLPDGTPPMLTRRTLNLDSDNDSSAWIEFKQEKQHGNIDNDSQQSLHNYLRRLSCDLQTEEEKITPKCLLQRSQSNFSTVANNKIQNSFNFAHVDRNRVQNIVQVREILHKNETNHQYSNSNSSSNVSSAYSLSRSSSYGSSLLMNCMNNHPKDITPATTGLSTPYTHHMSDSESEFYTPNTFVLHVECGGHKTRSRSRSMSSFYGSAGMQSDDWQSDYDSEYEIDIFASSVDGYSSPIKRSSISKLILDQNSNSNNISSYSNSSNSNSITNSNSDKRMSLEYIQENLVCNTRSTQLNTEVANHISNSSTDIHVTTNSSTSDGSECQSINDYGKRTANKSSPTVTPAPLSSNIYIQSTENSIKTNKNPFQSNSILFLDVDGVLLTSEQQKLQHPILSQASKEFIHNCKIHKCILCKCMKCNEKCMCKWNNMGLKFDENIKNMLTHLHFNTNCDIVISSSWQFFTEIHLPYLYSFLEDCGWNRSLNIHLLVNLLNINKGIYEQSPYCKSRADNILNVVNKYSITNWVVFDDLPLASNKYICIPKIQHITTIIDKLTEVYFQSIVWRHSQKNQLLSGIKEYVKYALTLPNSLFSENSLRFGFEFQSLTIFVCDAIARTCPLTFECVGNKEEIYSKIINDLQKEIYSYCMSNFNTQGNINIADHFIQTDANVGITMHNIDYAVCLLKC